MKRILILQLAILLSGILNIAYGQSEYMKFEKGKILTYKYGDLYAQSQVDKDLKLRIEILNTTETIEGKEYFIVQSSTGNNDDYSVVATSYSRVDDDGSILAIQKEQSEKEITMLKSPLKVGTTWEDPAYGGQISYKKVLDLNGSIETPAKTYSGCLVLETKENGTKLKTYFKKNVGMVASTIKLEGVEKIFIYLLED